MASRTTRSPSRLRARPSVDVPCTVPGPGVHPVGPPRRRDGLLRVPVAGREAPAPLVVLLHGAGGDAEGTLPILADRAEAAGVLLYAPEAQQDTWDVIRGGYGPDVRRLERGLAWVFAHCAVDAARVALAGFSDGASYALSLGLGNGDLFPHVIAFAPGFMAPEAQVGVPRLFVTHGTGDRVLPIDACSRRLVPRLESAGYPMRYVEFDGGHVVPPALAAEALRWFLDADGGAG